MLSFLGHIEWFCANLTLTPVAPLGLWSVVSLHFYKPAAPLGLRCVGFIDFIKSCNQHNAFQSEKSKVDEALSALCSKMRIAAITEKPSFWFALAEFYVNWSDFC